MLRKSLWKRGVRYRLYDSSLPGKPDIVLKSKKIAIFVDGDYWHGRALREGGPKAVREVIRGDRYDYWTGRFASNVDRDDRVKDALAALGWTVIRVWESDVLADLDRIVDRILAIVNTMRREPRN